MNAAAANPLVLGRKTIAFPPFRPRLPWLGGDLQTLRNTFTYRSPDFTPYPEQRLFLPMADGTGDSLWALLNRPAVDTKKPVIILIHGLTGCETSRNVMTSAAYHLRRGYPVLRLNLRGAGPSLGKCSQHYHAGRSADIREALQALPTELASRGIFIAGVSLGANVLLKMLGENTGLDNVRAAAATCAPIDLRMAQLRIMAGRNAVYHWHLLKGMLRDARRLPSKHVTDLPGALARVRNVYDFDDLIVAPNNGFDGAPDYYRRSSAAPLLDSIRVPTLLVHPHSDPWIPARMYLERTWPETGATTLLMPPDGGHVGFHATDDPHPWHDRCIGLFFDHYC
jgi:predicted alpha/beta-fold hydrolase